MDNFISKSELRDKVQHINTDGVPPLIAGSVLTPYDVAKAANVGADRVWRWVKQGLYIGSRWIRLVPIDPEARRKNLTFDGAVVAEFLEQRKKIKISFDSLHMGGKTPTPKGHTPPTLPAPGERLWDTDEVLVSNKHRHGKTVEDE